MDFLRNWVLHHWFLKLLALLISFLLWAGYTSEPFVEVGYNVPLQFFNIPSELEIAGDVPAQAHVRIRGRSIVLRRITPADLAVSVDLAGTAQGETLVHITPGQLSLPPATELVRLTPSEVRIRLLPRHPQPAR